MLFINKSTHRKLARKRSGRVTQRSLARVIDGPTIHVESYYVRQRSVRGEGKRVCVLCYSLRACRSFPLLALLVCSTVDSPSFFPRKGSSSTTPFFALGKIDTVPTPSSADDRARHRYRYEGDPACAVRGIPTTSSSRYQTRSHGIRGCHHPRAGRRAQ